MNRLPTAKTLLHQERGVSFEWVNRSKDQTQKFITRDFKQPKSHWTITVLPETSAHIPDMMYLIYTSDGLPAKGDMNLGDAKVSKRKKS